MYSTFFLQIYPLVYSYSISTLSIILLKLTSHEMHMIIYNTEKLRFFILKQSLYNIPHGETYDTENFMSIVTLKISRRVKHDGVGIMISNQ